MSQAKRLQSVVEEFPLIRVQITNWLLLIIMTGAAWITYGPFFSKGVLTGGLLAILSFIFLKKDLTKVLSGPPQAAKARFLIKYYARLTGLAIILFFLVRFKAVHVVGLLAGLSTVVISIGITTLSVARKFINTAEEAA